MVEISRLSEKCKLPGPERKVNFKKERQEENYCNTPQVEIQTGQNLKVAKTK